MEKEKEGFPITSLREINTILKAQHPNIVTVRVRPMHLCPQGPQCCAPSGHHTWGGPCCVTGCPALGSHVSWERWWQQGWLGP